MYSFLDDFDGKIVIIMDQSKSIFFFNDYKDFVRHWISNRPNRGRGELRKFAQALRVHSTLISQIVNGPRDLSLEQAVELGEFLELSVREKKYFLLLVQIAKAGSKRLRDLFLAEAHELRSQEEDLREKFPVKANLDERAQAEFYSNWTYSAVRLATDLLEVKNPSDVARKLSLPLALVEKRLAFLVQYGLCEYDGEKYRLGSPITHIPRNSPFVGNHHRNWRLKALERTLDLKPSEFVFTAPVAISTSHAKDISSLLAKLVEQLKALAVESKSEELRVLNIDWVNFALRPEK